ncbi:NAD(P)-binding oxidoreductase [Quadrisphaera sp. DSM 44207]|uniref:NAD(P)-binding oxidoreductase n=1 Tax=Quadrisphaera sp. DSM 44207 TaxID=1881057 RepID=UPI000B88CB5C|nr:NAD(P)-binding oxidoreductase [Quadrisphaera sp. DSM 44207]
MRIAVAGAHGQIARPLIRLLAAEGDEVVGLVRDADHVADVEADGASAAVVDLEHADVEDVAAALQGCEAVVFAAGAGTGSGAARKETMDRGGAALLADAAERAGADRYLLVSAMGVESVRDGAVPQGLPEPMLPYLRAKLASEDDLRSRDLAWTVLRPGALTDEPGSGRVRLAPSAEPGSVPRADVAAVLAALLRSGRAGGLVLELVEGGDPVPDAVAAATSG